MTIRRCGGWRGGPHEGRRIWLGVARWRPLRRVEFTDGACAPCAKALIERVRGRKG